MILCAAEWTPGLRGIVEDKPFRLAGRILTRLHEVGRLDEGRLPFIGRRAFLRVMQAVDEGAVE